MNFDTEALRRLLAKVEEASSPDRRLDYEIFTAFAEPGQPNPWDPKAGNFYTASIDAALALVERVLPGWILDTLSDMGAGKKGAIRFLGSHAALTDGGEPVSFDAATRPLAILGSLLTAALAQGGHHEA